MPEDFNRYLAQADTILRLLTPHTPQVHLEHLPPFPYSAFSPSVRAFIHRSAVATRVAPEMIAAPFLAFAGSTIGNQVAIDVGQGWIERPVLWIALVAAIGAGKTPAIAAARLPLDTVQKEIWDDWQRNDPNREPDRTSRLERLLTTDPTVETLIADLQSSRGIAVVCDELSGLVRGLNQNRSHRGDDRQKYLSLWSHQPIAPSRRSKMPTFISHPVVAIVGGIQPGLLADLRLRNDGLVQRFLPVVTALPVRYWSESSNNRAQLPDVDTMTGLFRQLRKIADTGNEILVERSLAARAVWSAWYNENVDRLEAAPHEIRGYYLKLPAHVARIALILHLLDDPAEPARPISADTMRRAIDVGEYFRRHIHRLVPFFGHATVVPPPSPSLESRIRRALAESVDSDGWLSRTEIYLGVGRPGRDDLTEALGSLLDKGVIQSESFRSAGASRPTTRYRLS